MRSSYEKCHEIYAAALETGEVLSQRKLAKRAGVSKGIAWEVIFDHEMPKAESDVITLYGHEDYTPEPTLTYPARDRSLTVKDLRQWPKPIPDEPEGRPYHYRSRRGYKPSTISEVLRGPESWHR